VSESQCLVVTTCMAELLGVRFVDLYAALRSSDAWRSAQVDDSREILQARMRRWTRDADVILSLPMGSVEGALRHVVGEVQ
jgi:hypothetical protein